MENKKINNALEEIKKETAKPDNLFLAVQSTLLLVIRVDILLGEMS